MIVTSSNAETEVDPSTVTRSPTTSFPWPTTRVLAPCTWLSRPLTSVSWVERVAPPSTLPNPWTMLPVTIPPTWLRLPFTMSQATTDPDASLAVLPCPCTNTCPNRPLLPSSTLASPFTMNDFALVTVLLGPFAIIPEEPGE